MAIQLEVEDYCHSCLDFKADVTKPTRIPTGDGDYIYGDTVVKCEYRKRCAGIKRYLEQRLKGDVVSG